MKIYSSLVSRTAGLLLLALPALARAENLAITGDTVYTEAGALLKNGVVLVRDGKIESVGPAASTAIPAGYRVLHAAVVTPGLIDAHATVGLSGLLNQPQDQDVLEKSSAFQPELRALDAYNAKDALVAHVRSFGVTTVNTGHAPGALSPGQTMIVKTFGRSADEDVVKASAMTGITLGNGGLARGEGGPGAAPAGPGPKSPGTRAKAVAMLRAELIKAQEYAKKREAKDETKRPGRDLKYETLLRAFDGSQPLLITASRPPSPPPSSRKSGTPSLRALASSSAVSSAQRTSGQGSAARAARASSTLRPARDPAASANPANARSWPSAPELGRGAQSPHPVTPQPSPIPTSIPRRSDRVAEAATHGRTSGRR